MTKFLGRALLLAGAAFLPAGLGAQTVGTTPDAPQVQLDLPQGMTTFGKFDPNFRKATAIVNGSVVTGTDVDHRLALVLVANGGQVPDDERERLRLQVLRNIIDETLQIQEAKAQDVTVSRAEIDQSYARVAARFRRDPAAMDTYLRANGSSARSMKRQIEGELAWSRVLRRKVEPYVNISEDEVQQIYDRLVASKGQQEFRVAEIFLAAPAEQTVQAGENARRIMEQVRRGGSFAAYARQFSDASTKSVGGDLGWVRAAQLPDALAQSVQQLAVGQLAGPIAVPGGVSILYLVDQRRVLTSDARDALLNLRQMSIRFAPGMAQAALNARAAAFAKATQEMGGCGKASAVAQAFNAEIVDNDQVRVRDLPPQLQDMVVRMTVGQATPPFGSPQEGVRVLVLCGRDDATANEPNRDAIETQIQETRVNQRAQRYLRDLRRDAVIEYR